MGLGIAEIDQHPVAEILATKPAKRATVSATERWYAPKFSATNAA